MWFQVDDQLTLNRKVRTLAERALEGREDGLAAMGVWTLAGSDCQASRADGVVRRADLIRLTLNPEMADRLAGLLVEVKLWHGPGHDCSRCPAIPDGTWLFHDWFDLGYNTREQLDISERKKRELKDSKIHAQVWARDCLDPNNPTVGACRYCGHEVKKKDTRSPDRRPELDHIDPNVADGARNIVLACRACNRHKGNRTPEEAGMTVLPAPGHNTATQTAPPTRSAAGVISPATTDAETTSPEPVAAEAAVTTAVSQHQVSPERANAETSQDVSPRSTAADTRQAVDQDATTHEPTADHPADHRTGAIPARGARAGAGQAGSGQGQGLGSGVGEAGSPDPDPHRAPRRKRRRGRGRGKPSTHQNPTAQTDPNPAPDPQPTPRRWDAGEPPPVKVPGTLGSPWRGWTGPPSTVVDESTCPDHRLPQPCRKCSTEYLGGNT
ncbi:HNH endonuclease [Prescottella equi]|uniref:HNH endonuclease n=1 Tax=Rhodococcus hoagii TaxID=43767 RepID=UPI0007CD9908|nr:HNH endonuclease [Prescottella equi]